MDLPTPQALDRLRADIVRLEARDPSRLRSVLPFGVSGLDAHLPGGGSDVVHGTAAALFAAGILASCSL